MIKVNLICVGKLKERFYTAAFDEYKKRLSGCFDFTLTELSEVHLSDNPSRGDIEAALAREGKEILRLITKDCYCVALCVEGKLISSEELSGLIFTKAASGKSKFVFIIGSSYGMADEVKKRADFRLSMSPMTFPHHLARVILAEQLYRSFKINEGSKYHK